MDLCQVVRYRAASESAARALAEEDAEAAARAGFVPADDGRWEEAPGRSALVVTYRCDPSPVVTRSVLTLAAMASGVVAVDEEAMATAGYVPVRHDWIGTSTGGTGGVGGIHGAYGSTGQGWAIIEYRYAPDPAGPPRWAVALTDERDRTGWWLFDEPA